jgi:MFS family permease
MSLRSPQPSSTGSIHYGWVIVLVAALVLFACFGLARYAYAMLLPAMQLGLKLSYDQTGFIGTGNFVGYLLSVLLVPFSLRRITPRWAISCGLLLISLALLAISQCTSFWQIFFLYILAGIGGGFANIPLMLLATYWFHRSQRGKALGLAIGGNGAGIVLAGIVIPFLNRSFGAEGWRMGWLSLGLICLAVTVIAALLLRNSPAEMGLTPIGVAENCDTAQFINQEKRHDAVLLLRLGLIYLAFGATFMIYGTFIVTTMVREYGLTEAIAGQYWSWVGFFSLFSGVIFGGFSDRVGRKTGLALVLLVQTTAYALVGLKLGGPWLIASIVLYGLALFSIPTIMTAAIADYLGLARAAASFATVTLFFAAGQSIGPGAAGLLARSSGSFSHAYLMSAGLTLLACLVAVTLPNTTGQPRSCGQK